MKRFNFYLFLIVIFQVLPRFLPAQVYNKDEPFAHTYSIVARDPVTGDMAVGVQSHWFSVGTAVPWGKSGVGVVATQSLVNISFGPNGISLMEAGKSAKEALNELVAEDDGKAYRQVAILDAEGNVHGFTGENCIEDAGHHVGNNYSVQANMMLNDKIVPAMSTAYEANDELPLAERIVAVLQAAQEAGGDIRGKQSAALIVVGGEPAAKSWQDKKIDLRVDDHATPVKELNRLLKVHRAYDHMNNGDVAMEEGDMKEALEEYGMAAELLPENLEVRYWKAVTLANNGKVDQALPVFKKVFQEDKNWLKLTKRLPESGLLNVSDENMDKITGQ